MARLQIAGVDLKPASDGAYLNEEDLPKIRGMFWHNNIVGFAPVLPVVVNVGGKNVPAGKYTINDLGSARTVAIRQADAKASAVVIASNVEQLGPGGPTRMVFHRYGDRYFLSQVWVAGSYRCTFAPSRIERELSARRNDPGKPVLVALR